MKRLTSVFFVLLIVLSVVACGNGNTQETTDGSDNPLLSYEVEDWPVKNGPGTETIGKWASITADKADFQAATSAQFKELIDEKVAGQDYNWFSVFFEDGTGLKITDSVIEYGKVDQSGTITESIEMYCIDEDGQYKTIDEILLNIST